MLGIVKIEPASLGIMRLDPHHSPGVVVGEKRGEMAGSLMKRLYVSPQCLNETRPL